MAHSLTLSNTQELAYSTSLRFKIQTSAKATAIYTDV